MFRTRSPLLAALAVALLFSLAPSASAETLRFTATADTYVDKSAPRKSRFRSEELRVSARPQRRAFLRFDVEGLRGRQIVGAHLRLYSIASTRRGARVVRAPSNIGPRTTYRSRLRLGKRLGTLGRLGRRRFHNVNVRSVVRGNGPIAFGLVGLRGARARFASSEGSSRTQPVLVLEVLPAAATPGGGPGTPGAPNPGAPATVLDGLSQVADAGTGSSDPTYFGMQHRVAVTRAGRTLAVYGRHGNGVQLSWRDPNGAWSTTTRGATANGALLSGTKTGDWAASIAISTDSAGAEHAWVVWSGPKPDSPRALQIMRISDLDSRDGPLVAAATNFDPSGGFLADIGFETGPDGRPRGTVLWSRKLADGTVQVVAAWLTSLDTAGPGVRDHATLFSSAADSKRWGTLQNTAGGMRAILRTGDGVVVHTHDPASPLNRWVAAPDGEIMAFPAAAPTADGGLLLASQRDESAASVVVQRFTAAGAPAGPPELDLAGYRDATLSTSGGRAWLVMVRVSDGDVVSREYSPATGWGGDRLEVDMLQPPPSDSPNLWPNAVRTADPAREPDKRPRLRFIVRGQQGPDIYHFAVSAFQRPV